MRRAAILFGLGVALAATDAGAAAPCPAWRERATMGCMRGYLRVDPVGMAVRERQVGYANGLAAGVFRALEGPSIAFGGRVAYSVFGGSGAAENLLHLRPELRLGVARERVFGYVLMHGGFSLRTSSPLSLRTSIAPGRVADPRPGWHIGLGGGAWWRVRGRLLLGAEAVVEAYQIQGGPLTPTFSLYMSVGSWL